MDVVAGYTCVNDISNRDDQRQEQNWVRGKAFDNACPIGPLVATPEHVPEDASIELRLNGETKQSSSREHLIFSIPELIAEITSYMTLEPATSSPRGRPKRRTDGGRRRSRSRNRRYRHAQTQRQDSVAAATLVR